MEVHRSTSIAGNPRGLPAVTERMGRSRWLGGWCALALLACAPAQRTRPVASPVGAPAPEPDATPRAALPWAPFDGATFARAKAEGRFVVLDGAAEWCHWCHVMEATTYHDPAVRQLLDSRFVAAKVDIDARPDVAERYGEWGWPATVVFAPDGTELGKYRGYLAPDDFLEILQQLVASRGGVTDAKRAAPAPVGPPLSEQTLGWIQGWSEAELDDYWDEGQGGWGKRQKAPLGGNNAWMLHRSELGDPLAKRRATFTLAQQSALLDPVWGGMSQYSAGGDWSHPHYEKLMTVQAAALENYANAYRLGADADSLRRARSLQAYIERFLHGPGGGFYASQDADLNAHEPGGAFQDGAAYYALPEKERLARGVPRIDRAEYAKENGLAIAAYVALYEATKDGEVLSTAERAARRILRTHAGANGAVLHAAEGTQVFLGDSAAFGFGLMRLFEVTKEPAYLQSARALAESMLATLRDPATGAFFATPADPNAVGVFATRRVPFDENVMAVRFLARLAKTPGGASYAETVAGILHALATPQLVKEQGRTLGAFLLALAESKGVRGN